MANDDFPNFFDRDYSTGFRHGMAYGTRFLLADMPKTSERIEGNEEPEPYLDEGVKEVRAGIKRYIDEKIKRIEYWFQVREGHDMTSVVSPYERAHSVYRGAARRIKRVDFPGDEIDYAAHFGFLKDETARMQQRMGELASQRLSELLHVTKRREAKHVRGEVAKLVILFGGFLPPGSLKHDKNLNELITIERLVLALKGSGKSEKVISGRLDGVIRAGGLTKEGKEQVMSLLEFAERDGVRAESGTAEPEPESDTSKTEKR